MVADLVQEIERLGLGQLLGLSDASGESVPRHNGFDGLERIAAVLLGLEQGPAQFPEQPHLVVDGLARAVEPLPVLLLRGVEEFPDNAIVQFDDFVRDRRRRFHHDRGKCRVPAPRLEFPEVVRRHLPAFPGDLEQPVAVDQPVKACRQIDGLQQLQAIDVLQHLP
ncbi:hypothetical protein FEP83_05865 [Burkholderia multivorans]|nr:hypothetical protein [Burkholderia multivorans]